MGPLHITLTRHLQVTLPHRDQHVVGREYVPRFGEPVLYVKICVCCGVAAPERHASVLRDLQGLLATL